MYYFSPLYHATGYIYGLPILLAFVGLKENKKLAALWILLPMLLVWGVWRAFATVMRIPDESMSLMSTIVIALLTGFVTVWLLGHRIGNRHRFATFFLAAIVMLICIALMLVEIETPLYRLQIGIFAAISWLVVLCGFVLAGILCRKRFGPIRFSLWLAIGLLLAADVAFGVFLVIQMFSYFSISFLWTYFIMSSIFTLVLWGAVLPFLVLFFVSGFWRNRFEAVMGIGGRTVTVQHVVKEEREMIV